MLHLPLLRAGRPYRSLDAVTLPDVRTGEPVVEVSQANRGLIARDLASMGEGRRALAERPVAELLAVCKRAARLFAEADLPVGDGSGGSEEPQSPARYLEQLAATTGMPLALGRRNLEKIRRVLDQMEEGLAGLSRGLDLAVLDYGSPGSFGGPDGLAPRLGYQCQTDALGAVLPGNSPGVHGLWLPAIPLKVPVMAKPGREEPWTPWRLAQAFAAAGCPGEALGFYPTDHAGATEILLRCGRSLLFGDGATVRPWSEDRRVEIHGPGWSKVILGEDEAAGWERHLDLIVASIADNGGRSCLNASGVRVAEERSGRGAAAGSRAVARELAEALARRLAQIEARPLDDPEAALAAFPNPERARRISDWIDRQLAAGGAEDLTAAVRGGSRVAEAGGCTFLLPTLIWCDDPGHPLAQAELLFPFASVVAVPQEELPARLGPTLVATALTADEAFARELLACPSIDRLNLGPVPTLRIAWDQPHEGNLFEHLYRRRALEVARFEPLAAGGQAA